MPYGSICSNSKPVHSIHMSNNLSWIYLWKLETKLCDKLSTAKLQHIFIIPYSISTIDRTSFSLIGPIIEINRMRPKYFMSISITFCCIRELNTIYFNSLRNSKFNTCIFYFRVSSITYPKSKKLLPILIINNRPLW